MKTTIESSTEEKKIVTETVEISPSIPEKVKKLIEKLEKYGSMDLDNDQKTICICDNSMIREQVKASGMPYVNWIVDNVQNNRFLPDQMELLPSDESESLELYKALIAKHRAHAFAVLRRLTRICSTYQNVVDIFITTLCYDLIKAREVFDEWIEPVNEPNLLFGRVIPRIQILYKAKKIEKSIYEDYLRITIARLESASYPEKPDREANRIIYLEEAHAELRSISDAVLWNEKFFTSKSWDSRRFDN